MATDQESAKRLTESDGKEAWIPVVVRVNADEDRDEVWAELLVNRQDSGSWARAEVRFIPS